MCHPLTCNIVLTFSLNRAICGPERGNSYLGSHYSGYNPPGGLFTVIMAPSVIGSSKEPIIILQPAEVAVVELEGRGNRCSKRLESLGLNAWACAHT